VLISRWSGRQRRCCVEGPGARAARSGQVRAPARSSTLALAHRRGYLPRGRLRAGLRAYVSNAPARGL